MKANLPQREPEILKIWDDLDIYAAIEKKNLDQPTFILHDGPPYANGDIHAGHALNKIVKDIIVKFKSMSGYRAPYIPGWDTHGQPIEHNIEKQLGDKIFQIGRPRIREMCREYALKFVKRQSDQFRRLGVRGDWKEPYLTLDHSYEAMIVDCFARLFLKGYVYRGRKPIHWCFTCRTALAEAEIEYKDIESPSIYVRFPVVGKKDIVRDIDKPVSFVIWTTTPWTLPANVAIALHPSVDYSLVDVGPEVLVIASALVPSALAMTHLQNYREIKTSKGSDFAGLEAQHPIFKEKTSKVILEDFVTLDQGTGIVHIAPGHGQEDYLAGIRHGLASPMPVDDYGRFTEEARPYHEMHVFDADRIIEKDLESAGVLLGSTKISHSYPHCWRCKKPVIFRATRQWFIAVDANDLRTKALRSIEEVNWIPSWNEKRIIGMVETRPDWCISRQRNWGVPIPVFYCTGCGEVAADSETFSRVKDIFSTEGADSWFIKETKNLMPENYLCKKCKGTKFEKENDILDVWFESGVSHEAVLKVREGQRWPSDLYVEGSDQHRGWFQSSLLTGVGLDDRAPYNSVLTNGWVVDGEGRAMHKSLGNVISPLDIMEKYGADIIRLWVASTDYASDMRISDEILDRISEAYRRIRNTARFILGNLYGFEKEFEIEYDDLQDIDKYMLLKLSDLAKKVRNAYENYQFHIIYHSIHNFCAVDLSSFYLDILKDRLYVSAALSKERRSAQTVLITILKYLVRMLSPILSFTSEEIWQKLPETYREFESVQLAPMEGPLANWFNEELGSKWEELRRIRGIVLQSIEEARNSKLIGNALEASVRIGAGGQDLGLLKEFENELPSIFIVSAVELSDTGKGVAVSVDKAPGAKCERCWNYRQTVGESSEHPTICDKCLRVLQEQGAIEES